MTNEIQKPFAVDIVARRPELFRNCAKLALSVIDRPFVSGSENHDRSSSTGGRWSLFAWFWYLNSGASPSSDLSAAIQQTRPEDKRRRRTYDRTLAPCLH